MYWFDFLFDSIQWNSFFPLQFFNMVSEFLYFYCLLLWNSIESSIEFLLARNGIGSKQFLIINKNSTIDDGSSPYYIHHSDNPRLVLVSQPLTGDNYASWSRAMVIVLFVKNKLDYFDGSLSNLKTMMISSTIGFVVTIWLSHGFSTQSLRRSLQVSITLSRMDWFERKVSAEECTSHISTKTRMDESHSRSVICWCLFHQIENNLGRTQ